LTLRPRGLADVRQSDDGGDPDEQQDELDVLKQKISHRGSHLCVLAEVFVFLRESFLPSLQCVRRRIGIRLGNEGLPAKAI
jgi:hypothetical protein